MFLLRDPQTDVCVVLCNLIGITHTVCNASFLVGEVLWVSDNEQSLFPNVGQIILHLGTLLFSPLFVVIQGLIKARIAPGFRSVITNWIITTSGTSSFGDSRLS